MSHANGHACQETLSEPRSSNMKMRLVSIKLRASFVFFHKKNLNANEATRSAHETAVVAFSKKMQKHKTS